jgi:hypothetical protein
MRRALWICLTCEAAGRPGSVLRYAGLGMREIDGAETSCAVWTCPAGHEHARAYRHAGKASDSWTGTPVRCEVQGGRPPRAQPSSEWWSGPPRPIVVPPVRLAPVTIRPVGHPP